MLARGCPPAPLSPPQAQLRKNQKAKTKNFHESKKESEELREMKRDLEEQHVENIQEFRKEVDILALRQKLEVRQRWPPSA